MVNNNELLHFEECVRLLGPCQCFELLMVLHFEECVQGCWLYLVLIGFPPANVLSCCVCFQREEKHSCEHVSLRGLTKESYSQFRLFSFHGWSPSNTWNDTKLQGFLETCRMIFEVWTNYSLLICPFSNSHLGGPVFHKHTIKLHTVELLHRKKNASHR